MLSLLDKAHNKEMPEVRVGSQELLFGCYDALHGWSPAWEPCASYEPSCVLQMIGLPDVWNMTTDQIIREFKKLFRFGAHEVTCMMHTA